jgi:hypothetical protein
MMFRIFKVVVGCGWESTAARKWKEEPHSLSLTRCMGVDGSHWMNNDQIQARTSGTRTRFRKYL